MKKTANKLSLGKQNLAQLDADKMASVKGGRFHLFSIGAICHSNNNTGSCGTLGGECTGYGNCHH